MRTSAAMKHRIDRKQTPLGKLSTRNSHPLGLAIGFRATPKASTLIIFKGSTYAGLTWTKLRAPRWVGLGLINPLFKRDPMLFLTPQIEYVFLTLRQTVCRFLRNAYEALNFGHRLYRVTKYQSWGRIYIVCGHFSIYKSRPRFETHFWPSGRLGETG